MRRRTAVQLAWVVVLAAAVGCGVPGGGAGVEEAGRWTRAVVGGFDDPAEVRLEIHPYEANAAAAQLVDGYGFICSGTLVGARVVLTAAHCVIENYDAWTAGEERAVPMDAANVSYMIGAADLDDAPCREIGVESIHLHPGLDTAPTGAVGYDLAVVLLREPAVGACPRVVPARLHRTNVDETWNGQRVYVGGYGTTSWEHPSASSVRQWTVQTVSYVSESALMLASLGFGAPAPGDSGSGSLRRMEDGAFHVVGVASTVIPGFDLSTYTRVDIAGPFFDEVIDDELVCGDVGAAGTCLDELLLTCDADGFSAVDCSTEERCDEECPCAPACDLGGLGDDDTSDDDDAGDAPAEGGGCATAPGAHASALALLAALVLLRRRAPVRA